MRPVLLVAAAIAAALFYCLQTAGYSPMNSSTAFASAGHPFREWKYIVIHHSATRSGNAARFHRFHRYSKKWRDGLAYHFVIGNGLGSKDGSIEVGKRWRRQIPGPHTGDAAMNEISIGICLVGDFQREQPTNSQMKTIVELTRSLQEEFNISIENVLLHREIHSGHTKCPGNRFPELEFYSRLKP